MEVLTASDARALVDAIAPKLGVGDFTNEPEFPVGRTDVCTVTCLCENGTDYGFSVVYLVWKKPDGSLGHLELANTRGSKDYLNVGRFEVLPDGNVTVCVNNGTAAFSGSPWSRVKVIDLRVDPPTVKIEQPLTFEKRAEARMLALVEALGADTPPTYQRPRITEQVADEWHKVAVYILFEQIDTDRVGPDTEGWLGDQFRYSLWMVAGDNEPVQLYEDHAYLRPFSLSGLTGTRGRDCSLKDLRLENAEFARVTHRAGERFETQTDEELVFRTIKP